MEKKLGPILLAFVLLCPSFLFSQTRICVINECRYSDNTNKFLKLEESFADPKPLLRGPAGTRSNMPIEQYLYFSRPGIKTKTGIKNRQAADIVTVESGHRLTEKGYDTIIPTNNELEILWKTFQSGDKNHLKKNCIIDCFRQYLCEYYRAELLVALTSCPFDMEIETNKVKIENVGKVVDAKMKLFCINTWMLYSPKEKKIIKTFTTEGNSENGWKSITKNNLGSKIFKVKTNFVINDGVYIDGAWDFVPYIAETAADAAEFFEQNL